VRLQLLSLSFQPSLLALPRRQLRGQVLRDALQIRRFGAAGAAGRL
jgi:hypothetical protein